MNIGFVGAGKMAEAIVRGLLNAEISEAGTIWASDISGERRDMLADAYHIHVTADNAAVMRQCDVVVLAVKPQDLDAVLPGLADAAAGTLVMSIAAGKRLAALETGLPGARVVRVMPNLACQVGEGMSVYCGASTTSAADLETVERILRCTGQVLQLDETQFDVVTALSGSGPAFFAYALEALVEGAQAGGMDRGAALFLAEQTMRGAATVLQKTGDAPADFMAKVASKGGTTAAGLSVLEASDVKMVLQHTLQAAADRSRELSA